MLSIMLLKKASAASATGSAIITGLSATARGGAKATKAVLGQAGELGAGAATRAGMNADVGRLAAQGTAVAGGAAVAAKGKRKVDEWRYRNGLYSGG
jgi:hypothetical protein